jgi:hypothetical protein
LPSSLSPYARPGSSWPVTAPKRTGNGEAIEETLCELDQSWQAEALDALGFDGRKTPSYPLEEEKQINISSSRQENNAETF